ncbi:MAG: T9SS type A sorting domain-containing protein, partial [Mucilaginibacter polytrichastri]|nr:T9SS type A sorting domain-containing protein [Mucilaginibacter polytrichastri]
NLSITLSPNPVRNIIGISSSVSVTNAVIRIADITGKTVYTSRANLFAGTRFTIDASAFAGGVYFVTVQSSAGKQVIKLVKEQE